MALRVVVLAGVLSACWTGAPPSARPRAIDFAPPVATCAVDPPARAPERLVLREWLGRIGDHSWLVAQAERGLVVVGLDGERVATTALPFDTLGAAAIAGDHLWLVGTGDDRTRLVELDVATAPARVVGAPIDWTAAPLDDLDAIAVSDDRVLFAAHDAVEHAFQLFDRAQRRIGSVVTVRSSEPGAAHLRCAGTRCFAIGVEGDDRTRRAFVVRFAADGTTESELLANDAIANLQVATFGARTIAVWTALDRGGLFARALDATGRPVGRRVALAGLPAAPLVFELITASPPRVAVRDVDDAWTIGTLDVDARRIENLRALPLEPDLDAFAGAVMPDGVLGAAYTRRAIERIGGRAFTAKASAVFVPAFGDAGPAIPVLGEATPDERSESPGGSAGGAGGRPRGIERRESPGGGGPAGPAGGAGGRPRGIDSRGVIAALPLIAPGHAAVLVVPDGFELETGGELVVVRRPCGGRGRAATAGSAPARTAR